MIAEKTQPDEQCLPAKIYADTHNLRGEGAVILPYGKTISCIGVKYVVISSA